MSSISRSLLKSNWYDIIENVLLRVELSLAQIFNYLFISRCIYIEINIEFYKCIEKETSIICINNCEKENVFWG